MKNSGLLFKFTLLSMVTIVLSLSTLVFGAPVLRVLRKTFGSKLYWLEGILVVSAFLFFELGIFAILLGALWLTVGLYVELEQKGIGWWKSGLIAIFSGGAFVAIFGGISYKATQGKILEDMKVVGEQVVGQLREANPSFQIEAGTLFSQLPSIIVVLLVLGLGVGLIFEKSAFLLIGLPRERVASQLRLLEFRVPDFYIWIALTSLLLSVVGSRNFWASTAALNIVNVSTLLYFFQGLAIIETFLRFTRMGILVKILVYLMLVGQMFTVVSFIGLIDFWIGFRERLKRYIAR